MKLRRDVIEEIVQMAGREFRAAAAILDGLQGAFQSISGLIGSLDSLTVEDIERDPEVTDRARRAATTYLLELRSTRDRPELQQWPRLCADIARLLSESERKLADAGMIDSDRYPPAE